MATIKFIKESLYHVQVRAAERAGAVGVVVIDNVVETGTGTLAMSGDGNNDVSISAVFLNKVQIP